MLLPLLIASLLLAGTRSEERSIPKECNPSQYFHYNELGCTPVFGDGPCPVKYNCPDFQSRSKDKCYVGGTEYEQGASIGTFSRGCSAACLCGPGQESAKVTCVQIECPEMFNPSFIGPGCIPQYSIDSCCSQGQFCTNETVTTTDITCAYNGSVLMEGQKFYPDEEPCSVCVCQQGFDGTLKEPWCKPIFCGVELHRDNYIKDGCIPIYFPGRCCPWEYRCPQEGDQVRQTPPEDGAESRTSADKCVYGSLQMNVGDSLDLTDNCLECNCKTPPLAACEKKCTTN